MKLRRTGKLLIGTNEKSVVYHYLATYFIVLLLPMVVFTAYCIRTLNIINKDDLHRYEQELIYSSKQVDAMLTGLSDLGETLAYSSDVNTFKRVYDPFNTDVYSIIELQEQMPNLLQISQTIFDYFIFFDRSEIVINRNCAYRYQDFYNLYMHESQYETYEEWYDNIKNGEVRRGLNAIESYVYMGETVNLMSYTGPLSTVGGKDNSSIRIYFDENALQVLLPAVSQNSILFIEDYQGGVIYSQKYVQDIGLDEIKQLVDKDFNEEQLSENIKLNGKIHVLTRYISEVTGLSYYILAPESEVNTRKVSGALLILILVFVVAGIGIFVSIKLSIKSATPINDILKEISAVSSADKESFIFTNLQKAFRHLVNANADLNQEIEEQKPYIKNAFFNRLIYGNFMADDEVMRMARYVGFKQRDKSFWIIVFRFLPTEEQEKDEKQLKRLRAYIMSLMEIAPEILPDSMYANLGDERVTVLMSINEKDASIHKEITEQKIKAIKERLSAEVARELFVYGSNLVTQLTQINEAYGNVSCLFHQERAVPTEVAWYQPLEGVIPTFSTADMTAKITHYVTAGEQEGLHSYLKDLIQKYIMGDNLPTYVQQMFLSELQIIFFHILPKIDMDEQHYQSYYEKLEENQKSPLLKQITITLNLYGEICGYVASQKYSTNSSEFIQLVVSYIDLNYQDSNLSLAGVADIFKVNESFLSLIFKEAQGMNFSTYVETLRMGKAKKLLRGSQLTVGQIARMVGYYSVNSFCRAFKRVTGISASEYRKTS